MFTKVKMLKTKSTKKIVTFPFFKGQLASYNNNKKNKRTLYFIICFLSALTAQQGKFVVDSLNTVITLD